MLLARYAGQPRADIALSAIVRSKLLTGALLSAKPDENRRIAEEFCALFPCDAHGHRMTGSASSRRSRTPPLEMNRIRKTPMSLRRQ